MGNFTTVDRSSAPDWVDLAYPSEDTVDQRDYSGT